MNKPKEVAPPAEIAPAIPPPPIEAPVENPLDGLVRGRMVYYRPMPYEARNADPGPWPAVVTHVTDASTWPADKRGICTLNVHLPVPTMIGGDPVARRTEVPYSETLEPGTWGWIFDGQGTSRGKA